MNYFVTGASGFIGRRLVDLLETVGRHGSLLMRPQNRG